jgi:hypothetical protein
MPWFAAHAITYFKWKDSPQDKFHVWENVILIEAPDGADVWSMAEDCARQDEGDSEGSLTSEGHPATQVFAGIRKVTEVFFRDDPSKFSHGDEVTFTEYDVSGLAALKALAAGERAMVEYSKIEYPEKGPAFGEEES